MSSIPQTTTLGPLIILALTLSTSGDSIAVELEQEVRVTRQMSQPIFPETKAPAFQTRKTLRQTTRHFSPAEVAGLRVGQELPAHLGRTL